MRGSTGGGISGSRSGSTGGGTWLMRAPSGDVSPQRATRSSDIPRIRQSHTSGIAAAEPERPHEQRASGTRERRTGEARNLAARAPEAHAGYEADLAIETKSAQRLLTTMCLPSVGGGRTR